MSALKGQKATSPGQRPGFIRAHIIPRPERAKAFHSEGNIQAAAMCCKAFAPSGRKLLWPFVPRALPWAGCSLPLRGAPLWYDFILPKLELMIFTIWRFTISSLLIYFLEVLTMSFLVATRSIKQVCWRSLLQEFRRAKLGVLFTIWLRMDTSSELFFLTLN